MSSMTKHGAARFAASQVTRTHVDIVTAQYLAWIDGQVSVQAAINALLGVADRSKRPDRVLALAAELYDEMDDYPEQEANLPDRLSEAGLAATYAGRGKVGLDAQKANRDRAYRTWDALAADTTVNPGLHVFGHSVVSGTGATSQPYTFGRVLKAKVETVRSGAVVTKHGLPGDTTTAMLASVPDATFTAHAAGTVGCLVIMAMLNDYSAGVVPATTQSNLEAIIAAYRADAAAADNMTVVIASEWLRQTASGGYGWDEYVAAAEAVADADEYVTVVNLYDRMGQASGDTLSLYSDGTHPTNRGHGMIADTLYGEIMRGQHVPPLPDHTMLSPLHVPLATVGTWNQNVVSGTAAFGNVIISSADGSAAGDEITYTFLGRAGFYTINLSHQRRTDAGKYDLYLDGVLQGAGGSWDGYAASVGYVMQSVANFSVKTSGLHTLTLKMGSKNASSSAYKGSICGIGLTRTGDLTS